MAVLPNKYSKRGPMSAEDYIIYMSERIEFYSQAMNKRVLALEKEVEELKKNNKQVNV